MSIVLINPSNFYNHRFLENIPPKTIGVYYFYNAIGEVIYVGKSRDIRKRMLQHFFNPRRGKGFQMMEEVAELSYEHTGTELIALLLESSEIKNLKPVYNVSQKRTRAILYYGIFQKLDRKRYINLYVKKWRAGEEPLMLLENKYEANAFLEKIAEKNQLCLAKCAQHTTGGACFYHVRDICRGACVAEEAAPDYNRRAKKAMKSFGFEQESFFIVGAGRNHSEKSIVCIEQGKYRGFGYIDFTFGPPTLEDMRDCIRTYDHNRNIQQILFSQLKTGLTKIPFESGRVDCYSDPDF